MNALQEFDLRSRAVGSLVDDWRSSGTPVRNVWKLADLVGLAIKAMHEAVAIHRIADGVEHVESVALLGFSLASLRKLADAVQVLDTVIGMFESEGHVVERAAELRDLITILNNLVARYEAALEEAEWNELERTALSSQELGEIAEYLRAMGQAAM